MADVWRYESGVLKHSWLNEQKDWDHFEAVKARGQGVLLITPHLGNWELGGPLLAHHGYKLLALTQAEPATPSHNSAGPRAPGGASRRLWWATTALPSWKSSSGFNRARLSQCLLTVRPHPAP